MGLTTMPSIPRDRQAEMPPVELHIEQLVLHGFAPHEKGAIAQAVEAELLRLLSQQGLPPTLLGQGALPHLDGGAYQVATGQRPQETGRQIAQAIYRGLSQPPSQGLGETSRPIAGQTPEQISRQDSGHGSSR